jgi:hypothetical protein
MASRSASPPLCLDLSDEEGRTIIHRSLDRRYRDLLDHPIPVLGNLSPRAAARTSKGRTKNPASKQAGSKNPIATFDFSWLWTELDVGELRR